MEYVIPLRILHYYVGRVVSISGITIEVGLSWYVLESLDGCRCRVEAITYPLPLVGLPCAVLCSVLRVDFVVELRRVDHN
jgi:hypothetical protein